MKQDENINLSFISSSRRFSEVMKEAGVSEEHSTSCIRSGDHAMFITLITDKGENELTRLRTLYDAINEGIAKGTFTDAVQASAMKYLYNLKVKIAKLQDELSGIKKDYKTIARNLERKMNFGE